MHPARTRHLKCSCLVAAAAGAALVVSCKGPEVVRQSAASRASAWSLWSAGCRLRGANIYQRRVYPELDDARVMGSGPVGPEVRQEDFHRLARLGANAVFISHPGLFTEVPPYEPDRGVQASLDRLLHMVDRAGLRAVLAFRTGPGRSEFSLLRSGAGDWFPAHMINDAVWTNRSAQQAWADMWEYTAARYRDADVVVGYELMVEPNACDVVPDAPVWPPRRFARRYAGTGYDWNLLYPRLLAAVRRADPDTPVLIGSDGYSSVAWLPTLKPCHEPRVVYTVHQYEPGVYTHQAPPLEGAVTYPGTFDADWDRRVERVDKAWLRALYATVREFGRQAQAPTAVSEVGVTRWAPGAAQFMHDQLDLLEAMGMNYGVWLWECSDTNYSHRVHTFNFRLGPSPENRTDLPGNALLEVLRSHWRGGERRYGPGAGASGTGSH